MNTPTSTERVARNSERAPREAPEARQAQPPMTGLWSADGRLFSPLGVPMGINDNAGAAERLLAGWEEALASQRAMLDVTRDMVRRQQDLMLAATRAMLGAAMNPAEAAGGPASPSLERSAAQYGAVWRRGLEQAWANYWAMLEMPGSLPTASNETEARRPDRAG